MSQERNPLDLNNLPEDYTRYVYENKKKSGSKDGKDESGKVYECRFCSLKFSKSQALGGHMNRHRQEKETETLNRARQLVFSNDSLIAQRPNHALGSMMYPTRLLSGSGSALSTLLPPPFQPYMDTSSTRQISYPSQYGNDHYFVGHGHVLPGGGSNSQYSPHCVVAPPDDANYTYIGAPVGRGFVAHNINESNRGSALAISGGGGSDISLRNQEEGRNWALPLPLHR